MQVGNKKFEKNRDGLIALTKYNVQVSSFIVIIMKDQTLILINFHCDWMNILLCRNLLCKKCLNLLLSFPMSQKSESFVDQKCHT